LNAVCPAGLPTLQSLHSKASWVYALGPLDPQPRLTYCVGGDVKHYSTNAVNYNAKHNDNNSSTDNKLTQ